MKKVSIIVPVYNVEKYLTTCLESLVNQTLEDIEIIIVNDGSKDDSQNIINNFYNNYPDKIKHYTIENAGAAQARNYGLEKATGEYIGFVDSDDYVELDMFEKLYNKARIENSDIAVCGYYRNSLNKCEERGTEPKECFGKNVLDSKELFLENLPYIWNKIFKKELINKEKIKFEKLRIFEDLLFTYKLFLKANNIVQVAEPLYYYKIERENSLTSIFSEKRFDIFKAADKLIKFFKENDVFEYFKDELLFIILKHIYVVLQKDISIKSIKLKNKFINQAFKYLKTTFPEWKEHEYYYKRYKKNKIRYTSKIYWKTFLILDKRKRKFIMGKVKMLKKGIKVLKTKDMGNKYKKYLKLQINTEAILINSQHGSNINGNMFYILRELATNQDYKNNKIYISYKKQSKNKFTKILENYNLVENIKLIDIDSPKYAKILATAKFVFNDTSFPAYYIKPKGQIYLNTWHGTPLKTLGKSTTEDFHDIANLQKNFVEADYLLYPNEYTMNHMVEDYMLNNIIKNKIMLCGYPRNEIFFDVERRQEVRKNMNLMDKQVIAYMPTWRGNVRKINIEEHIKRISEYLGNIDKNLKENQIMFVNLHPYIGDKINYKNYKKIFVFPAKYETYDFLNACDTLITDYSSVFFDYAITKNKIILFTYDEEEYLKDRGLYIKLNQLPFPKVDNVNDLIKEINNKEHTDIGQFCKEFCNYDRKDVSKYICEVIIKNSKTDIKILDNSNNIKNNVFIYAGHLQKSRKTDEFIKIINNTKNGKEYNYYLSYITKNIKRNKQNLKEISEKIDYMGQLGTFNNCSKFDKILMYLLSKNKKIYLLFNKKYNKIFEIELKRIYADINIKAIIAYGKIGLRKLYTISNFSGKKILYLNNKDEFNTRVNKTIYDKYDYILTSNDETLNKIKKYCSNKVNIEKIIKLNKINDIEKFLN